MPKRDGGGVGDKSILQFVHVQAGEHVKEKILWGIRTGLQGCGGGGGSEPQEARGVEEEETKIEGLRGRAWFKGELRAVCRLPTRVDSAPPAMFTEF